MCLHPALLRAQLAALLRQQKALLQGSASPVCCRRLMLQQIGVEQVGGVLLSQAQTGLLRLASQHRLILIGQETTASVSSQPGESHSFPASWVQPGCGAQGDLVADHLHNAITTVKVTAGNLLSVKSMCCIA